MKCKFLFFLIIGFLIIPQISFGADTSVYPTFKVYANTNQVLSDNSWNIVQLDTEVFDTSNAFDTSTYEYTVPITGYYTLSGTVLYGWFSSTPKLFVTRILKNGVPIAQNVNDLAENTWGIESQNTSETIVFLNEGDIIKMDSYQNTGATTTLVGTTEYNTYFSGGMLNYTESITMLEQYAIYLIDFFIIGLSAWLVLKIFKK